MYVVLLFLTVLGDLFSVTETARKLGGVSPWTVRSWLTQGRLKRTKVGGRTMVSGAAISEFLAECAKPKPAAQPLPGPRAAGRITGRALKREAQSNAGEGQR